MITMLFGIITGCSQPPQEPDDSDAEETVAEPEGEMILNVSRTWEKESMDPATWTTVWDIAFGPNVFENLLVYDENDMSLLPSLAESWDVTEDGLTYTFNLRHGVQFHKGYGEMKASDVKFSIERMKDPETNAASAYEFLKIDNMAEIEIVDDYTLSITLNNLDVDFLDKMADWFLYIVSEKAVTEMGLDEFAMNPIGTGPFQFDKGQPAERTEIVKFDDYWGEKAKIDRVINTIVTEANTVFSAFEVGEFDLINISDHEKILEYQANPDYTVIYKPSRYTFNLGYATNTKPFDDIRVRKAASYAINREDIIENITHNLEELPTQYISENTKYAIPNTIKIGFDPEKAKELLAEAGYPDGLKTSFWCPNDYYSEEKATVIQSNLMAVGINAELMAVEFGTFIDKVRFGQAPIWLLADGPDMIPDAWLGRWTSRHLPQPDKKGNNWCSFSNAEYDKYVDAALNASNEEEKAENYAKAQEILGEEVPYHLITWGGTFIAMKKNVKGVELLTSSAYRLNKTYID